MHLILFQLKNFIAGESRLSGILEMKIMPGPPDYTMNTPETCLFLNLHVPQNNIATIQLNFPEEQYNSFDSLLGKPVTAFGSLFRQHTGHHHTELLMNAKRLSAQEKDFR